MTFQVPYDYSSSPLAPSTPDRRSGNGKNIFAMSNPSTTPAGPPPSSANSFTPAGQPPSSVFGSSMMGPPNPVKPLSFAQKSAFEPANRGYDSPGSSQFVESLQSSAGPSRSRLNQEYKPTPRRGFQAPESDYEDEDSGDYTQEDDTFDQSRNRKSTAHQDDDSMADDEPRYDDDDDMDDYQSEFAESRMHERSFGQRSPGDLLLNTPAALKRSQQGGGLSLEESFGARRKPSTFGKIAKDMYSQMKIPETDESDDLILNTESIIARLYEEGIENTSKEDLQETLTDISGELTILWSDAQDWCEATIGLLVWWDEGKEDRRVALGQSRLAQRGYQEDDSESYADNLAKSTHKYGEALWYYALAHKTTKMDIEAAELLRNSLSGYATLRKFFDVRDETISSPSGGKPTGTAVRRREAAAALFAVITSSSDNIRGGLYDEDRGAVVSVDFLLALLGEALPFVNQNTILLTVAQIETLLRAIEDLQTVGPRIYNVCSEFLETVLASAQGLKGSAPSDMLRKSTSNISAGSFSMVGSSMLASQMKQSMSSSGVLVKGNIKRGWDWRKNASANMKGDDLLRILRLGLATALADAWLREADGGL
ncbi:hypothetical protein M7I_0353 [Glarea lozoyensis 74030]|uniref:Nuclear pore complex protein Nup85 n=1 Tax=Glarea lozoyensis (strain ATCC 74030 / MF5533) TaxID=1104152 RepID=H0ED53_GLAL7|nr:hypothetical protein M7I_0353 [Glarea lozoyensis 74030]